MPDLSTLFNEGHLTRVLNKKRKNHSVRNGVYGAWRCWRGARSLSSFGADGAMARWFKDFPINFRNGTDKIRSVSESDSQHRDKPRDSVSLGSKGCSPRKGSGAGTRSGGAVSCLLSGRNRKNSANETSRTLNKDERVWDSLFSGKSRKTSKSLAGPDEHRTLKTCISASTYITRLIKVEKQDRIQQNDSTQTQLNEDAGVVKSETVRTANYIYYCFY